MNALVSEIEKKVADLEAAIQDQPLSESDNRVLTSIVWKLLSLSDSHIPQVTFQNGKSLQ